MPSKRSPTERTLKWLRSEGYVADVVERRIPRSFVTKDFCGFADIIAFKALPIVGGDLPIPLGSTVAVQTTSGQHAAERLKKVQEEPRAQAWLACGNRILVISWAMRGAQGTRKLWVPSLTWLDYTDRTETMNA